ncbi:MAG: lytic transglycosylase domain-containing protein [Nannocystaceae bacterium]
MPSSKRSTSHFPLARVGLTWLALRTRRAAVPATLMGVAMATTACSNSQVPASRSPAHQPSTYAEQFGSSQGQKIAEVQPLVEQAARRYHLDPSLINAMIWVESRFDSRARGPSGSKGLMQLMPATAREIGKQIGQRPRPYDPEFNIQAGSYYLARMLRAFDGDSRHAIAAYNAGPGSIRKRLRRGDDISSRSESYVRKVREAQAKFSRVAARQGSRVAM